MTNCSSAPRKFWLPHDGLPTQRACPQAHAGDGYLRLCDTELESLEWVAAYFFEDPFMDWMRSGAAEWCALRNGQVFSLGWDWFQVGNQGACIDVHAGIRTNIQIRDRQGYDLPGAASEKHLLGTICQLPWHPAP